MQREELKDRNEMESGKEGIEGLKEETKSIVSQINSEVYIRKIDWNQEEMNF